MDDRFELVSCQRLESEVTRGSYASVEVLRDKQTGVMYLCQFTHAGMGLTVLVDKNGKPVTSFKVNVK